MEIYVLITTIVVALITAVFGPIALLWAKSKFIPTPTNNLVDEAIELNSLVDDQLGIIMEELKCDRVWISQFHNGGHFYPTGKSIQKFSIFYEKVTLDTLPSQHTFQNIPCSLFPKAMSALYKEGEIAVPTLESETYDLLAVAKPYGSKSFYLVALDDLQGKFIDVLSVDFKEEYKLSKEDWIFIRQKAGVIGTLLDGYLNAKK